LARFIDTESKISLFSVSGLKVNERRNVDKE